ncbi:MAG TPA: PP2C family protein-serine/threonine phosphatase [Candidatus Krumholzibacteria bacterium]|nr:PP2C family protein-serine/threonine phosphatase [Candidatus Krumholzibacteria bacterium]
MSRKAFRLPFGRETAGPPVTGDPDRLREENRQLKRAVEELSILNDLARTIGASVDSQDIIHKIVDRSMRAVQAEQTVVTLVAREEDRNAKTLVRVNTSSSEHPKYHLNDTLLGWMYLYKKPLLCTNPGEDERFKSARWDHAVRSVLCVPLLVKGALIGVISCYNKRGGDGGFTEEDQRLLAIIAGQSAQIIENARLYEEEKALGRMKEELRLAAQIQQDLLPKKPPVVDGYDLCATSIAALMVGGDYFDFIPQSAGRTAICLGDVSGKGMPASLLMASLQATLRGQSALKSAVSEIVARSNTFLYHNTDPEKFATLFMGVLDPASGELSYCNAGHERPILVRAGGRVDRLMEGGLALGVLETFPYGEGRATLDPGDFLVVYSDGIPEATDELGNFFGEERLLACLQKNAALPAPALMAAVIEAVRGHEKGSPRADDLTIVVVRRAGA